MHEDKEEEGQTEMMEILEVHSSPYGPLFSNTGREKSEKEERERERLSCAALSLNAESCSAYHACARVRVRVRINPVIIIIKALSVCWEKS